MTRQLNSAALAAALILATPPLLRAQPPVGDSVEWLQAAAAGSEDEEYLRYLQVAGIAPLYPLSARGLSPRELARLAVPSGSHPLTGTMPFVSRRAAWRSLPLDVRAVINSGFPYGFNDGAVWAGRGVTASASGGGVLLAGPASLTIAPIAFATTNSDFRLFNDVLTGPGRYADPIYPDVIDYPQRFGSGAYGRADLGQTSFALELGPVTGGVSGANMVWGPMSQFPFVLGSNAPGFIHAFAGTARPVNLWVARLHGRVLWGRLEQSAYSPVQGGAYFQSLEEPGTRRFATGLVLVATPRGLDGLELGISRFFHAPWPRDGLPGSYFTKAFSSITKSSLADDPEFPDEQGGGDNQLVSAFARWVFPSARTELYGEYGREDHAYNRRDLVQEPDHSRSYGFGIRHVIVADSTRLHGIRFEHMSFQPTHLLRTGRGEGGIYTHAILRQGHTHRGQLLGAWVGAGEAAGTFLGWDRHAPRSSITLGARRTLRRERGTFYEDGTVRSRSIDVQYALEGRLTRRTRRVEISGGLAIVWELNRDFRRDAANLNAGIGARIPLGRGR